MANRAKLVVLIAAAGLSACGAGDSGSGGGQAPPPTFTVGGSVTGLTGPGLTLQLNGGSDLSFGANAPFTFTTRVAAGSNFTVSVAARPGAETCVVSGGSGVMPTSNVSNVSVSCSALAGFSIALLQDPLAPEQWHLLNNGQTAFADVGGASGMDIKADGAFGQGFTGAGVTVAVVDTGLEIAHEDLAANVIPGGSWNFISKTTDPTSTATDGDHGTSVAGLIAMARNSVGGIGVAPSAKLKGFNFLAIETPFEFQLLDSLGASGSSPNSLDVAIFNQSFGIDVAEAAPGDPTLESQYLAGVTNLRGGKGALYVKAGGNGFLAFDDSSVDPPVPAACAQARALGVSCENVNFDPDNVLPYQIVVGAVNANGIRASYSSAGSALWVSAPGGEFGENASLLPTGAAGTVLVQPAMISADQSGCAIGFSTTTTNNGSNFNNGAAPNTSCNYWNGMNGTSSATPVVSGVIALMLEANPMLTWRDVKHILASTAQQIDASRPALMVTLPNPSAASYTAEPAWTTNAAGFHFHNWYGFGMVDANAAVTAAASYSTNLGTLTDTGFIASAAASQPIPDNSATGASSAIKVPANPVHFVEAVQITVSVAHNAVGDLGIELVSPQGTRSVLKNIRDGFGTSDNLDGMVLLSNAFYGEDPKGTWVMTVVDGGALGTGTLKGWSIRIYGH
jgi:subtilisin family serine protease